LASVQPYGNPIVPDPNPNGVESGLVLALEAHPELQGHDGVEILVDMARRGDIDPWNLDLTAVADQYLLTVQQLKASDLRLTGKVLLYLAILLRMKSDILTHGAAYFLDATEDYLEADQDDPFADLPLPNVVSLETVLKRRTNIKQPRIRPVTLFDLISELQKIETLENRQAMKQALTKMERRRSQVTDLANWTVDDIETMAHEEFVEDTLDTVSDAIEAHLGDGQLVALEGLVAELRMDRITVFLALLFLAARTELVLHQPDFYGPLMVQKSVAPVVENFLA
jgi:segregation and condensation protein A